MKKTGLNILFGTFIFSVITTAAFAAAIKPGDPGSTVNPTSRPPQPTPHTCSFSVWADWLDAGNCHSRTLCCAACGKTKTESAGHKLRDWSDWLDGGTNHYRTRNCGLCSRHETESANHNYGAWSAWSSTGAYHTHSRCCSVCDHGENETVAHSYGAWSAWHDQGENHNRFRTCIACGKKETETRSHSYESWSAWIVYNLDKALHTRTRSCTLCDHTDRETAAHLTDGLSEWQAADNNTPHFAVCCCELCGYTDRQHAKRYYYSWSDYANNSPNHARQQQAALSAVHGADRNINRITEPRQLLPAPDPAIEDDHA